MSMKFRKFCKKKKFSPIHKHIQCKIFPKTLNVLYLFRLCRKEKV